MPVDSPRRVTLVDEPPVFDGAEMQLRFVVDVDGEPQTCAITVEALEDHFGAPSLLERDLLAAFEAHRSAIEAMARRMLEEIGGRPVLLHSGHFRLED